MRKFKFKYLPSLYVQGWCDGNLVTFDHECLDTNQTLEYMTSGKDEEVIEMALERLVETVLHNYQIKENKKKINQLIR